MPRERGQKSAAVGQSGPLVVGGLWAVFVLVGDLKPFVGYQPYTA